MYNYYGDVPSVTFYSKYEKEERSSRSAASVIDLSEYGETDSVLLFDVFRERRRCSAAISVTGLGSFASGSVYNFGSDGEVVGIKGDNNSQFHMEFPKSVYGNYYGEIKNLGSPTFMSRALYSVGTNISITGAGSQSDAIVVIVESGRRHAELCATVHGLIANTSSTVCNFGFDGSVVTITGNGADGFKIETSDSSISSVYVTITNLARNAKGIETKTLFSDATIENNGLVLSDSYVDVYELLFVSIHQNGRQAGFFSRPEDIIDSELGVVLNFGSDGQVASFSGNGKNGFSVSIPNAKSYSLDIMGLVMESDYRAGDEVKLNTFKDLHFIPDHKLTVNPSSPQYSMLNIVGTSSRVDVTEYLPEKMSKTNRTGSWTFYIDHYQWPDWISYYNVAARFLNGHKVSAILEDDPYKVYIGYVTCNGYTPGENYSTISISYDFDGEPAPVSFIGNAPIKFIKTDGSYYDVSYAVDPRFRYLFDLYSTFYREKVRHLSLTGGTYELTPVPVGELISFADIEDKTHAIYLGGFVNGRFFSTIGTANDLMSITDSEVFNFGSDGCIARAKEYGHAGVAAYASDKSIGEIYVTLKEHPPSYIYNHVLISVGNFVSLQSALNKSEVLVFSITESGKHVSFCATTKDICENTLGTVYSFGIKGELMTVTGNGSDSFKIEVTDSGISSVVLSVMSFELENIYNGAPISKNEEIDLSYVNTMNEIFISISSEGRRAGLCAIQHDLVNCTEGKVLNFGSDGAVVKIYGDGTGSIFAEASDSSIGAFNLTVSTFEE